MYFKQQIELFEAAPELKEAFWPDSWANNNVNYIWQHNLLLLFLHLTIIISP